MCGVAGLITSDGGARERIRRMTDAIWHRGPDSGDSWLDRSGRVALGHRRLAILDLSERGKQPMISRDGSCVLAYNGEVYNFKEIRAELELKGYAFASGTDTEVVLAAYQEWGVDAVRRFNGMWAFLLWDEKAGKLVASRDYVGIKPMYYAQVGSSLILSSEIKGILASGLVSAEPDLEGLNEYFTFQNVISERTLFRGVKMLPAGCTLEFSPASGELEISRYWDFDFRPDDRLTADEAEGMFVAEFERAVERHLISDVEVGATISGGMDSSAIVSVASKKVPRLQTFTGWFDTQGIDPKDRSFSELDDAAIVARTFGTKHHQRQIGWQDQIDSMPAIVWHLEDPKVGMCYTFLNISHLVSQHVKVSLSGTGGDEIFAGYPWRYQGIENVTDPAEFEAAYYKAWSRVVPDADKGSFFAPEAWKRIDPQGPLRAFREIMKPVEGNSPVNRALYFDAKTFLHGMLMVEDKLGMAYSIETRFPFLDKKLIELAQRIPDHLKYKDGVGKYIFRKAFSTVLPREITQKRKQGFTPPDLTWYRRELRGWIQAMLLGPRTLCHQWIDRGFIEKTLARHDAGADERFVIWSLLYFEGWCRTYLNGQSAPAMRLW